MEIECRFKDTSIGDFYDDTTKLTLQWPLGANMSLLHGISGGAIAADEPAMAVYPVNWLDVARDGGGLSIINFGTLKHLQRDGKLYVVLAWGGNTAPASAIAWMLTTGIGPRCWTCGFRERRRFASPFIRTSEIGAPRGCPRWQRPCCGRRWPPRDSLRPTQSRHRKRCWQSTAIWFPRRFTPTRTGSSAARTSLRKEAGVLLRLSRRAVGPGYLRCGRQAHRRIAGVGHRQPDVRQTVHPVTSTPDLSPKGFWRLAQGCVQQVKESRAIAATETSSRREH